MTKEEIIRLARESELLTTTGGYQVWMPDNLEAFAALVAAAEREACAEVCEEFYSVEGIAQDCAEAIRARGEK